MKKLLALAITVALCGHVIAQDRSKPAEGQRGENPERQRDGGGDRQTDRPERQRDQPERERGDEASRERAAAAARANANRRDRTIEVKDPAGFKKLTDDTVFSGPQPGEKLPSFKATGLAGDIKDKEIDPIANAGDKPHIIMLQDDEGVGIRGLFSMVGLLKKLDAKTDADLHLTCVFLTDDIERTTVSASRFGERFLQQGLDVLVVSKEGREGPGAYGLNRSVSQTMLLAKDGKVLHNFVFPQGALYADPHVLGGVAELIGESREDVAAWLNEATAGEAGMMRDAAARPDAARRADTEMRRDGDRPREAAAQTAGKVALRTKLAKFVEAGKLTSDEAAELLRAAFPEAPRPEGRERGR